jgi:hypothetical protein
MNNDNSYFNYHDLFENFESDQSDHFQSYEPFEPIDPAESNLSQSDLSPPNLSQLRNEIIHSAPVPYVSANGSYIKKDEMPRKGTSLEELKEKLPVESNDTKEEPKKMEPKKLKKESFQTEEFAPHYEEPPRTKLIHYKSKELKEFMVILLIGILMILMLDLFTKINLMLRKV